MTENKSVVIAGQEVGLVPLKRAELKGVFTDALLQFIFYRADFQGNTFLLLATRKARKLSPLQYKNIANRIKEALGMPCAFLFASLATYERNRLIEKGVYFIVSKKYVYLPFVLINAKSEVEIQRDRLIPSAQYILLYHLQAVNLNGFTLQALVKNMPLKYVTLSRGLRQLEALQLIDIQRDKGGVKSIHFHLEGKVLWDKALPLMQEPVRIVYYADAMPSCGAISGINALSHYTAINPEEQQTVAVYNIDFQTLRKRLGCAGINRTDGEIKIEVWKYPPIQVGGSGVVDKLSLYLVLKNDKDPRVEKELETMINSILW